MSVRVRYAPSPTGFQHIGGIRTALINYLFAHAHKGNFVVRVEDTDRQRSQQKYFDNLFESLQWLGLNPDESGDSGPYHPYIQSQRVAVYQQYVQQLIDKGLAYYCFTSLQKDESDGTHRENTQRYDRSSRNLSHAAIQEYRDKGILPVIRLKMPLEGSITIQDELLGTIIRNVDDIIIDPILLKSDGYPTYHLANVIDDHLMNITHVMRSQEWIPTTPVHVYLYEQFNWKPPIFCHLPMVLGEDGQKLSKRNGSMNVLDLQALGILPEALINCIALLGWSYDDSREFFTKEELISLFLEGKINKSPSQFSMKKLRWFNAHYIRALSLEELLQVLLPMVQKKGWVNSNDEISQFKQYLPLVQERMEVLSEVVSLLGCVYEEVTLNKESIGRAIDMFGIKVIITGLTYIKNLLETHGKLLGKELEQLIKKGLKEVRVDDTILSLKQVLMPLRIAITGSMDSALPIISLLSCMNTHLVISRIENTIAYIYNEE